MSRGLWPRPRLAMVATAGALMVTLMAALWPAGAAADVGAEAPRGLAAWASAPRRQNAGEHIASFAWEGATPRNGRSGVQYDR